jgi:hypothetical protein
VATQTRAPTSDEAVSGTWTGTAGQRWSLVDDYPDATGADILTGGTTSAVITFGFAAFTVPAGATVTSVAVNYYDSEAATGANNCGGRIKVGGTYYNAVTHNPAGTTYTARTDTWATNPKTGAAWTVGDVNGVGVNALQAFGMNSTDSNPTWRFASIQVQVTYTEAVAITGDAAITDAADTVAGAAAVVASGSISITEASDSTISAGAVPVGADAAVADEADAVSAELTAQAPGTSGTAAIVDAADTAAATGAVRVAAVGAATDGDTTSSAGAVRVVLGGVAVDGADQVGAAASGAVQASSSTVEGQDATSGGGSVRVAASVTATDGADVVQAWMGEQAAVVTPSQTGTAERNRRQHSAARRRR